MNLVERRVKESPVEVRDRVFEWVEKNRTEILRLLEQGRSIRLDELALCNGFYEWSFENKHIRLENERCLSEMALCGEVKLISRRLPLDGFDSRKVRVKVFTENGGVEEGEISLFDHVLLAGPDGMVCCLTPGQFIFGSQDVEVIDKLSGVSGVKTCFPEEKFGPGDRLKRLKELMPGAVRTFGGGLGVLCASVYAIDRELGLKFVEVVD